MGRVDTKLGDAYFRVERIRFEGDAGAFVVTILPADDLEETRSPASCASSGSTSGRSRTS